ncbi:MAG: Rrf2 family transcriptional regulator [Gammaproteobacteria bacterium]|jgi:FeS assembly SUF system regulator|nr:Rrf2 family transcriptional regulator [Gammaproteobacteria bacterium]
MLRISRLADYAAVIMRNMSAINQALSAAEIAQCTAIHLPTVRKLLKQLLKAGLLVSERGANGGYQLARASEQISLADIVEAIDGPLALTECSHPLGNCVISSQCVNKENWLVINKIVKKALSEVSLVQMGQNPGQRNERIR